MNVRSINRYQPVRDDVYAEHAVYVPPSLSDVTSTLDYIGISHIEEYTHNFYTEAKRPQTTGRYVKRRAYKLFSQLIQPELSSHKAENIFSKQKIAAAYEWYGLDIQPPGYEDITMINPAEAVLGVAGLLMFARQTYIHPQILDHYGLNVPPTYLGPLGDKTPNESILNGLTAYLEIATRDERSIGQAKLF